MKLLSSNNIEKENNNWNLALLTFVVLIFLFLWFYSFLLVTEPKQLKNLIDVNLTTD